MSGFLDYNELEDIIKKSDVNMSVDDIKRIVKELDYAENGRVNYSEFIAATINARKFLTETRLLAIF